MKIVSYLLLVKFTLCIAGTWMIVLPFEWRELHWFQKYVLLPLIVVSTLIYLWWVAAGVYNGFF